MTTLFSSRPVVVVAGPQLGEDVVQPEVIVGQPRVPTGTLGVRLLVDHALPALSGAGNARVEHHRERRRAGLLECDRSAAACNHPEGHDA